MLNLFSDHRRQGPEGFIDSVFVWEDVKNLGVDDDDVRIKNLSNKINS